MTSFRHGVRVHPYIMSAQFWTFSDPPTLYGGFQLEFVSISRVINHMTSYNSAYTYKFQLKTTQVNIDTVLNVSKN